MNQNVPGLEPAPRYCRPLASRDPISTDAGGLTAGGVRIPAGDIEMFAYRAMPANGTGRATVLVVQEIFGVHEHIRDVCRRFAKSGYFAVAPDLYARQGDVSRMTEIRDIISGVASKVPDEQVMSDLDFTVAWAERTGNADISRLGITGFCWGGRIVWLYAAHSSKLKAAVAWYGRLEGDRDALHPRHPIDVAASLKAPVLGLYGAEDESIPLASVERMREALKASGILGEIVVYPNAGHAFHADYRPSYRKEAAEDGWRRLLEWFRKHGVS